MQKQLYAETVLGKQSKEDQKLIKLCLKLSSFLLVMSFLFLLSVSLSFSVGSYFPWTFLSHKYLHLCSCSVWSEVTVSKSL